MMMVTLWLTRTGPLWYLFHETDRWTKPKQVRCQFGHKVTGRSEKTCEILSLDGVLKNPSQVAPEKGCAKRCSRKKTPRRDRNVRTPFREKAKEPSTERITGAELRKRTRCHRCHPLGRCPGTSEKFLHARRRFCTIAQSCFLHGVHGSEPLDGNPDGFENEADWAASNDEPEQRDDTSKPKHHNFVGLILGPARGLTDTGAQQPVGTSAAQRWCERLRKRHGLVPVDVSPNNMTATCGGIESAKVARFLDVPAGIVGVNGVVALSGTRGVRVNRREATVRPAFDTSHTHASTGCEHSDEGKR